MRLNSTCHRRSLEQNFTLIISRTRTRSPLKPTLSDVEPPHQDDLPLFDKHGGGTCLELMLAADFLFLAEPTKKEPRKWKSGLFAGGDGPPLPTTPISE